MQANFSNYRDTIQNFLTVSVDLTEFELKNLQGGKSNLLGEMMFMVIDKLSDQFIEKLGEQVMEKIDIESLTADVQKEISRELAKEVLKKVLN